MKQRREVRAVIYDKLDNEKLVLLIKNFQITTLSPQWRLLKGGMQKNETEEQALRRECYEELGLEDLKILGKIRNVRFYTGDVEHFTASYRVRADSRKPIRYNSREVAGYHWFKLRDSIRKLSIKDEIADVKTLSY